MFELFFILLALGFIVGWMTLMKEKQKELDKTIDQFRKSDIPTIPDKINAKRKYDDWGKEIDD